MRFVGGDIHGILNPELIATEGSVVAITIIKGDGLEHGITFPDFGAMPNHIFA